MIPSILQAAHYFVWGGITAIYLPKDWPVSHINPILRILGQVGLAAGLILLFGGMIQLGIEQSFGLEGRGLRKRGLYQISRNPQILACVLYIAAFTLLWPSWDAYFWGILLTIVLHMMVITEEEHLRNKFGQSYIHYCQQVPRYLGKIKSGIRK